MPTFSRAGLALMALIALQTGPVLAETAACKPFKWSLTREQGWFQASPPTLASGATLAKVDGAADLQLSPVSDLKFPVTSGRKPATDTYGALLTLPPIEKAGLYQVTLSEEGWIDVVQAGATVKYSAATGQKACTGLRKSVRFNLQPGPVSLQISGVKAQTVKLAVAPAE
ncbi:hypothetical protein [Labrys neptuniae]